MCLHNNDIGIYTCKPMRVRKTTMYACWLQFFLKKMYAICRLTQGIVCIIMKQFPFSLHSRLWIPVTQIEFLRTIFILEVADCDAENKRWDNEWVSMHPYWPLSDHMEKSLVQGLFVNSKASKVIMTHFILCLSQQPGQCMF